MKCPILEPENAFVEEIKWNIYHFSRERKKISLYSSYYYTALPASQNGVSHNCVFQNRAHG
jgi:hypothetical protein